MPNRTKEVVAETCIVGHVRRFMAYGGHGIVWGTYWADGDGLGGQEGPAALTCCEMCLLLTKHQLGPQVRIAHERAQYAQKDTHELLLPATPTAPRHPMKRLQQAFASERVEICTSHPSTS